LYPLRGRDGGCSHGQALAIADEHGSAVLGARVHRFSVLPPHMYALVIFVNSVMNILEKCMCHEWSDVITLPCNYVIFIFIDGLIVDKIQKYFLRGFFNLGRQKGRYFHTLQVSI
jgi:hypothetical protein